MTRSATPRGIGAGIVLLIALVFSLVSTGSNDARADTTPL
jgi:hypothetical protein